MDMAYGVLRRETKQKACHAPLSGSAGSADVICD